MTDKTKITVVGSGYVGMSLAVLLSQHNDVVVLDVDPVSEDDTSCITKAPHRALNRSPLKGPTCTLRT